MVPSAVAAGGAAAYSSAVLASSPTHFYRFNSLATDETDFSGNGNDNTPPNGGSESTFKTDGPTGTYLEMAGYSDGYDVGYSVNPNAFSCEVIVRPSESAIVDYWGGNDSGGGSTRPWIGRVASDGEVTAYANNQAGPVFTTSGVDVRDGAWHQIVFTHNWTSGETSIFVDGAVTNIDASAGSTSKQLNSVMTVGSKKPGNSMWQGGIAEWSFYESELSAADVLTHFNASGI